MKFNGLMKAVLAGVAMVAVTAVQAGEIRYDTWTSNENPTGNYILTVSDDNAGRFDFDLTIDPWNVEALGLFVDFGSSQATGSASLSGDSTVSLYGQNTSSNKCGGGCSINGMSGLLPSTFDGEWGLVFSLGNPGSEGLRTFSWSTSDFGLGLDDFGVVALRGQDLCAEGVDYSDGEPCNDSDKSFGYASLAKVPEPGVMGLMGLGLLVMGIRWGARRAG